MADSKKDDDKLNQKEFDKVFEKIYDRAVSYLPNIFKCLEADALGGEAFFREKSSCLFHLLQILRNRKVFRVNE